jgi:DNA-binding LytR/AlgR family response regulator
MNELKCMIVDDEPIARDILKKYIDSSPELVLVKSCMNATEAYEGLYQHEVDLVFLDIQMPVITGVEFLRSLRNPPLIIFTTAYQDYAVEGFELNSVDYLLKPITYDRFYQAIQKAKERAGSKATRKQLPEADYIFIKQDSRLVKINHNQILYIEAEKDFSTVFYDDKKLLAGMHLKMFEAMLPEEQFFRVHRSYIINLSKINSITGNIVELNKKEIPIGASYKNELISKLRIG